MEREYLNKEYIINSRFSIKKAIELKSNIQILSIFLDNGFSFTNTYIDDRNIKDICEFIFVNMPDILNLTHPIEGLERSFIYEHVISVEMYLLMKEIAKPIIFNTSEYFEYKDIYLNPIKCLKEYNIVKKDLRRFYQNLFDDGNLGLIKLSEKSKTDNIELEDITNILNMLSTELYFFKDLQQRLAGGVYKIFKELFDYQSDPSDFLLEESEFIHNKLFPIKLDYPKSECSEQIECQVDSFCWSELQYGYDVFTYLSENNKSLESPNINVVMKDIIDIWDGAFQVLTFLFPEAEQSSFPTIEYMIENSENLGNILDGPYGDEIEGHFADTWSGSWGTENVMLYTIKGNPKILSQIDFHSNWELIFYEEGDNVAFVSNNSDFHDIPKIISNDVVSIDSILQDFKMISQGDKCAKYNDNKRNSKGN